jgi:transposase InsO family protein
MEPSDAKRLRALEDENSKLKKLLAEQMFRSQALLRNTLRAMDGRRFRILVVVDDFSRENLVLVADTSLSGQRVARNLDRVSAERGMPKAIVSDNGNEFTSMAILKRVHETGIDWHYIAP